MISPILPAHDADTITLDFGVFIADQARTYRTSQQAVLAALRPIVVAEVTTSNPSKTGVHEPISAPEITTPSQPELTSSQDPVADTPAVSPASEPTDGEAAASSLPASPSVANETTGDAKFRDPKDWEDEDGVPVEAPARRKVSRVVTVSLQEKAQKLKSMHPTWTPFMIAKEIGANVDNVLTALGRPGGQGEPPEALKGEEAQRAHYAAVAKRLGRSR